MNTIRSSVYRFHGVICSTSFSISKHPPGSLYETSIQEFCTRASRIWCRPAAITKWLGSVLGQCTSLTSRCGPLTSQAEGAGVFQQLPWHHQQVRTRKRGTEYQPKNIKRKRTHGWIKRISTQGGIEVILRRMLKGRKSLSH